MFMFAICATQQHSIKIPASTQDPTQKNKTEKSLRASDEGTGLQRPITRTRSAPPASEVTACR